MSYIGLPFVVLTCVLLIAYYGLPIKARNKVLLIGSILFALLSGVRTLLVVLVVATFAFVFGKVIKAAQKGAQKTTAFVIALIAVTTPWLFVKLGGLSTVGTNGTVIAIVGISFYTLELISYLAEVFKDKQKPEKGYFKFLTYALYFPKLVQGPISRYDDFSLELIREKRFDYATFSEGFVKVLYGFFLKLVIADKAAILINPVFERPWAYQGVYCILAAVLYSVEIYADFLGCVEICLGVSDMLGIKLFENFKRPYMSTDFKQFWNRWHISLSKWLSDYIYIPLGGSRKGNIRRYINLAITFIVSAFWHGVGVTFLIWGLLHALYRIFEELLKNRVTPKKEHVLMKRIKVFALATFGWVFFRAASVGEALSLIKYSVTGLNRAMFDGALIKNTMGYKEFLILVCAILFLAAKEMLNERKISFMKLLMQLPQAVRIALYVAAVVVIMVFGTYGVGFDASAFIYGGF